MSKKFEDLNLDSTILKAINELGFTNPTSIQEQAIPQILEGHDLRASAETGTGKTAAFILPALQRLLVPSQVQGKGPRILVLVPTRELAMQVAAEATKFSKYLSRAKTVCIYGGQPYPIQNRQLSRPYELLIATPGRLIDHMERGKIDFSRIEMFILDEADRMLDMGFSEPVEHIAEALPESRQTLMFSATLSGAVTRLFKHQTNKVVEISVAKEKAQKVDIDQRLLFVDSLNHKYRLLDHFLSDPNLGQTIIFTATKRFADELAEKLAANGHQTAAIHGDLSQRQRTRTLAQFRQGDVQILVATDVAARGIDVQNITHVINFEMPGSAEDYVHRIGRTGRAGAKGTALSFAAHQDSIILKRIQQYTGQVLTPHVIPGLEPQPRSADAPTRARKRGPHSTSRSRSRSSSSFKPREGEGASRPFKPREGEGASRSFKPREGEGAARPFKPREGEGAARSFKPREGEGAARSFKPREGEGAARPFKPREGEGAARSFKPREGEGAARSFKPREGEGRSFKPRSASGEGRPFKPREGEGAARSFKPRSASGEGRPFKPRSASGEGRPFKPRASGEGAARSKSFFQKQVRA